MKKALVVGRNYCNILAVARQLGEAGFSAKVLKIHKTRPKKLNFLRTMAPDKMSKYVETYREIIASEADEIEAMLAMAESSDAEAQCVSAGSKATGAEASSGAGVKMLLIPVDDYSVYVVDENLDALKEKFLVASIGGRQGAINEMMDKARQKAAARAAQSAARGADAAASARCAADASAPAAPKLRVLKSWLIETGDPIPEDITYPVFIKPNVSMKATKARMKKIASAAELEKTLAGYGEYSMLVEEFCDIKQEYSLLGFSTGKKAYAPALFMATMGGHKERKGVAVMGKTLAVDEESGFKEIAAECEKFVESLGYDGIFDIDLMEDQDGKIYFVEINFRAGASIYAFDNLVGEYAKYMLCGKEPGEMKFKEGLSFVSEKVLMEEFVRGDATKEMLNDLIEKADVCFVKNEEDPAPFDEFKKYYFMASLLRLAYKVRG